MICGFVVGVDWQLGFSHLGELQLLVASMIQAKIMANRSDDRDGTVRHRACGGTRSTCISGDIGGKRARRMWYSDN